MCRPLPFFLLRMQLLAFDTLKQLHKILLVIN